VERVSLSITVGECRGCKPHHTMRGDPLNSQSVYLSEECSSG